MTSGQAVAGFIFPLMLRLPDKHSRPASQVQRRDEECLAFWKSDRNPMTVPYLKNNRRPWLDLVRFLAALIVVLGHARGSLFVAYGTLPDSDRNPVVAFAFMMTRLGHEAVLVFFVLSGMLVGGRAIERIRNGSFDASAYAIDRTVRIMLPLLPALMLTALIQWHMDQSINLQHFLLNLVSLQGVVAPVFGNNAPLWSLAYEVWVYVLVAAFGMVAVSYRVRWSAALLVLAAMWVFTHLDSIYLLCWLSGTVLYFWRPQRLRPRLIITAGLLALYAITSLQLGSESVTFGAARSAWVFLPTSVAQLLFSIAVALLLQQLACVRPKRPTAVMIDDAGSRFAAFSYTLYLTHYPVLQLLHHAGIDRFSTITIYSVSVYCCAVGFCCVSAWCLYWCFERHTLLVRRFLKNHVSRAIHPRAA